uniref:Uncharacterized protein n=1 Tax=Anopheles coluzzii TaxID=1518534 RepID=A0A8W7PVW4_ANOCL
MTKPTVTHHLPGEWEQLVAPCQQRRDVLADLGGRLIHTHLVQCEGLLRTALAVKPAVDGRVLAYLIHPPGIAFAHRDNRLQVACRTLLYALLARFEPGQAATAEEEEEEDEAGADGIGVGGVSGRFVLAAALAVRFEKLPATVDGPPYGPVLAVETLRAIEPGSGLYGIRDGMSTFVSGLWKAEGLVIHSCSAFWSRRTCSGFEAIPTSAMISRNSSSPRITQLLDVISPLGEARTMDIVTAAMRFRQPITNCVRKRNFWPKQRTGCTTARVMMMVAVGHCDRWSLKPFIFDPPNNHLDGDV